MTTDAEIAELEARVDAELEARANFSRTEAEFEAEQNSEPRRKWFRRKSSPAHPGEGT